MSPTWAPVIANDRKPRPTQTNVTRNPRPTEMPAPGVWGPRPGEVEATKSKKSTMQRQKADNINANREEYQDPDILDEQVIMDPIQEQNPPSPTEVETSQDSDESEQDTPVSSTTPPPSSERITLETPCQPPNGTWTSPSTETRTQINDSYFRSVPMQDARSHMICANFFCRSQIPVRGIKGRWATCETCQQKTCIMSSCSLLERSHVDCGWEICPNGAAAMGLERIARVRSWERCEGCHRFLVKVEGNPRGRSVTCGYCVRPMGVVPSFG